MSKIESKHYGIVDNIAEYEPDAATGNLSVSAVFATTVHSVASTVVVGSTASSEISIAQMALTGEQALKLGALLSQAGADALEADREVENLRMHGPAAARLCFALAKADMHDVLCDQSKIRLGYPQQAQGLAERAYTAVVESTTAEVTRDSWRQYWREAGERLSKETARG